MRQRSEQYFTSSQTFSHFLRQVNGRWQWMQILLARLAFLIIFIAVPILKFVAKNPKRFVGLWFLKFSLKLFLEISVFQSWLCGLWWLTWKHAFQLLPLYRP